MPPSRRALPATARIVLWVTVAGTLYFGSLHPHHRILNQPKLIAPSSSPFASCRGRLFIRAKPRAEAALFSPFPVMATASQFSSFWSASARRRLHSATNRANARFYFVTLASSRPICHFKPASLSREARSQSPRHSTASFADPRHASAGGAP